jgi:leucyl aminopeptidase
MGKAEELDAAKFSSACMAAGKHLRDLSFDTATSCLHEAKVNQQNSDWCLRQSIIAIGNANYFYTATKEPKPNGPKPLKQLGLICAENNESTELARQHAAAILTGFNRARSLGDLPPNFCNPVYLAEQADEIAAGYANCTSEALDTEQMQELGMNALLGVARGSRNPPRFIILRYTGAGKDEKPVVLIGKGITFDTGGISLKPGDNMDQMKYDMCGAAGVIGTFEACAKMQLPLNLVVIVAAAENMPDGDAYRPGDVITSMSGQTIEVLNTDAEGRMVLCDALTYAQRFEPAALIDVATLTGACVVALGHHASGLMSKSDSLVSELVTAGNEIVDRAWRLPLWDEYQTQLDTPFADMKNIGGMPGGSITAGCFLSRFAKDQNWAHIDIAGSAWKWGTQEGATGRPVGLLSQFLINHSSSK